MAYYGNILEEELKNKVAKEWFPIYDTTQIIGKVDFCVAVPGDDLGLFETESLLWAEAKRGTDKDIYESFVQLILTIGRARTFDNHLPPMFLGIFNAEKIGFLPYDAVLDVFYQNDFNWNVPPSNHYTKEFRQLLDIVKQPIKQGAMLYRFKDDGDELRRFIRQNFISGKRGITNSPLLPRKERQRENESRQHRSTIYRAHRHLTPEAQDSRCKDHSKRIRLRIPSERNIPKTAKGRKSTIV